MRFFFILRFLFWHKNQLNLFCLQVDSLSNRKSPSRASIGAEAPMIQVLRTACYYLLALSPFLSRNSKGDKSKRRLLLSKKKSTGVCCSYCIISRLWAFPRLRTSLLVALRTFKLNFDDKKNHVLTSNQKKKKKQLGCRKGRPYLFGL